MGLNKNDFVVGVVDKYPEELLKGRVNTESCVIGCILKDVILIDDIEMTAKDFLTVDGRYYFSLASHLRKIGLNVLDEVGVTANITEEMSGAWEERGGWATVENVVGVIDLANFEKYCDDLCKYNLLIKLHNDGFNLFTEINDNGKKYRPIDLFERFDAEQVSDWYESRLANIGLNYAKSVIEDEELDIDDIFIAECEEGVNAGISFEHMGMNEDGTPINALSFLSKQVNGLPEAGTSVIAGYSNCGKSTISLTIILGLLYQDRKVCIISNEERISRYKEKFLLIILAKFFKYYSLTRKKLSTGNISEEDRKMIAKAQKYWRDNYKGRVHFVGIPDADPSLLKRKIKDLALRKGYDTFYYDTMKISFTEDNKQTKEYMAMIQQSRDINTLAQKYNLLILYSMQMTLNSLGKLWCDPSLLSTSKQTTEIMENLFMMRNVFREELSAKSKYYLRPFRREYINGKWITKEYEPDPDANYRVMFVSKCRQGTTSDSDGIAYLLKFDGAHATFSEQAFCYPSHGTIV